MDVINRVREALVGHERVLLAVSGGIDSMVLLEAAARAIPPHRLIVATFDHGTGSSASAACRLVERRCQELNLECVSGSATGLKTNEGALRDARWAFLRAVARERQAVVATAHTEDDQIETVLMRVMRGAGARGIAALYAESAIVRPLLGTTRAAIAGYARQNGVVWLDDPSNESGAYFRNRVRHDLLPALRRVDPSIASTLLDLSRRAAALRGEVESLVDSLEGFRILAGGVGADVSPSAFESLDAARLLWPAIAARAGVTLERRGIERAAAFSLRARVGARIQIAGGWELVRARDALQLRPSNIGKATPVLLRLSDGTRWGDWSFRPAATSAEHSARDSWAAWLPVSSPLSVRPWQAGDAMSCRVGGSPRKVKRLLSEAGVTGHQRAGWPVVLAGDQIVWIPGVRRGPAATARSGRPGLLFVCEYIHR